jgi:hypothetical protein
MSPHGIYATRASRVWTCELDQEWFSLLNKEGFQALDAVGGYCIDAPEQIPAGSMKNYSKNPPTWSMPTLAARYDEAWDLSVAELARRNALADRLIAEILAEEHLKG